MANEIIIPDEVLEQYGDVLPQEEAPTEEAEEAPEEEAPVEEQEAEDERTVPLSALRKEREETRRLKQELAQRSSIINRLMESTGAESLSDLESKMDETQRLRLMRDRGYDELTAREFMDLQRENSKLKKSEAARGYDDEVNALAGNPYYDDIADVRNEVEEYARDKNISIKQAYNALFGEQKAQKLQELAKKQAQEAREAKDAKKIKGLSSAGNAAAAEGDLGLSADELAVARAAGISPADYKKYKDMS